MRRGFVQASVVLALAGCGGKEASVAPTTTASARPSPMLTSPSERAQCAELESRLGLVSQVVSGSVELMTQSLHPKELAQRTGEAEQNLLYAASVLELMRVPPPLAHARRQLVVGLRTFAEDFGRAKKSVARGDMATAAQRLNDRAALASVTAATKRIDRLCRSASGR